MNKNRLENWLYVIALAIMIVWFIGDSWFDHDWPRWYDIIAGSVFLLLFGHVFWSEEAKRRHHVAELEESNRARIQEHNQVCVNCGLPWHTRLKKDVE